MPPATRWENARGRPGLYFGSREKQDILAAKSGGLLASCFGRGARQEHFDAPEVRAEAVRPPAAAGNTLTGAGRNGSTSSVPDALKPDTKKARRVSITEDTLPEGAGSGSKRNKVTDALAADAAASGASTPTRVGRSSPSATSEAERNKPKPRSRASQVAPIGTGGRAAAGEGEHAGGVGPAGHSPQRAGSGAAAGGSGNGSLRDAEGRGSKQPGGAVLEPAAEFGSFVATGSGARPHLLGAAAAVAVLQADGGEDVRAGAPTGQALNAGGEPMFTRRGASCSGVEAGTAAVAAMDAARLRASIARRTSYAGEVVPANPAAATLAFAEEPALLRPSPSLRPSPLTPSPLLPSSSLLRHQQGAVAAAAPPPQQLLLPSPSLLRAQQNAASGAVLLLSSPSLLRAGQQPPIGGAAEPLRLPPPVDPAAPPGAPVLKHNPASFSRNTTTTAAVAALTLKQAPSMARGNALPPMVTAPSPAEAAAALNRLASIQMIHRQKLQEAAPGAAALTAAAGRAGEQAVGQPFGGVRALGKEGSGGSAAAADGTRAIAPVAPAVGDAGEGDEAESVVAELPARQVLADTRESDGSSGSGEPVPVRRAVSYEPTSKPEPEPQLPRAAALSETGDGAAAAAQPYMAKRWLDSLQPPLAHSPSARNAGPPPIEAILEPEISAGSLASAFDAPPRAAPVVAPLPGAVDSFKTLLREIEPCVSSRLGKPAPVAGWERQ